MINLETAIIILNEIIADTKWIYLAFPDFIEFSSENSIMKNLGISIARLTYQSKEDCLRRRLVLNPIIKPTIRTPDPAKNHLI